MYQEGMEAMSSFRIGRQYVSYTAAETQPVYASGLKANFCSMEFADAKPGESLGEMQLQAAEIIKKAEKEALERAKQILTRARTEAEAIAQSARQLADETVKHAQNQTEKIREEAKNSGYSQGQKTAKAQADARKAEEAEQLRQLEDKLKSEYTNLVDNIHEDAVSLVMEVVRKIINIKLERSDEIFIGLVNGAIEKLQQTGTVIIHVGSEDYNRYFDNNNTRAIASSAETKVIVVEEESYLPGDLVVSSEGEVLDYSIRRQLEKVEKAFSNEENWAV